MKNSNFFKGKKVVKTTLLASLVLGAYSSFAQERTCGMEAFMHQQMQDPTFAKQHKKMQAKFEAKLQEIQQQKANGTYKKATLTIPVAVHFPAGNEADRACLEALAQNQVDILNEDYTATNADISQWNAASSNYPGINFAGADVTFCIATQNHPANTDNDLVEGGPAVTIGYNFGGGNDSDPKWAGYMNFLIKDIGALGYSPLGGSIAGGASVVMDNAAFGSGSGCPGFSPGAPYNLGRTVTHELGHFYNLDHTFNNGCAGNGDNVADTPPVANPSYGCPAAGSVNGCNGGEKALTMSYMDYVDDACMYMFSQGQIDRAEAYLAIITNDFKQGVTQCGVEDFTLSTTSSTVATCSPNDAVFNLTFETSNGYDDNTTLSASGVPSGATATFSPTTINADGSVTLTISNLGGVAAGSYPITITATGTISKTLDVTLSVEAGAPATTSLSSPANGTTGLGTSVDLYWSAAANAATYTVEVATDAGFSNIIATSSVGTTMYSATGLTPNTQYFWRVKSMNGCGEASFSSAFNFTTEDISCTTYNSTENNLTIPASGADPHVVTSTLNIPTNMDITDVNITINVDHTWAGDVELELMSPNGTSVILLPNSLCDDGTNDIQVTYDDQAAGPVVCSNSAPAVGGIVQPDGNLSDFIGEQTQGNWVLTITDGYPSEDGGTFLNFDLEICGTPIVITNVEEAKNNLTFDLWPNPSDGTVNVTLVSDNAENVIMELFDLNGRLVDSQSFVSGTGNFNQQVKFNNTNNALYILKVSKGEQQYFKRVMIK